MSGLAGCLLRHLGDGKRLVAGMLASQHYRGQDYLKIVSAGPSVHFGVRGDELSPATTDQPLVDHESKCTLVGDIRLDNRIEVSSKLSHAVRSTVPDERLVLLAYLNWGKKCVDHLIGDFAFAVWDPSKNWLFVARDHFGVRQLTYSIDSNGFVFATDVAGVLAGLDHSPRASRKRLIDFHIDELEGATSSGTFYEGVFRLPAAHSLVVDADLRLHVERYWKLLPPAVLKLGSDSEYLEAFESLLGQAIDCRVSGVKNFGAMLSGGLDSSAIVAHLRSTRESASQDFPVYSGAMRSNASDHDDSYFIRLIADHLSLQPSYVYPGSSGGDLDGLLEEPDSLFDTSMIMPRMIYSAAGSDGVKVVLDGLFGDEILETEAASYWHSLIVDRSNSLVDVMTAIYTGGRTDGFSLSVRSLVLRYLPKSIHQQFAMYRLAIRQSEELRWSALQLSFSEKLALAKKRKAVMNFGGGSHVSRKVALFNHPFTQVGLERYDRVAARHRVECRHPLLDKRLVEFCLSLPVNQTLRNGHSRWILRQYLENLLPAEAVWRPKGKHLGLNFGLADKLPVVARHWKKVPPAIYSKERYDKAILPPQKKALAGREVDMELARRRLVFVSRWLDAQGIEVNTETLHD